MRIGLIADIHGNADALRAVLGELSTARLDRVVCLGDVAVLGPEPGEVVRLLNDEGCAVVRGNTDAWLLDAPSDAIPPSPGPSQDLLTWTKSVLTEAEIAQIGGYPLVLDIDLGGGRVLRCAHGSPRSFEDVIGPATPVADACAMLGTEATAFAAGGHTHIQMVRRFEATTFVNPGSVGLPGVGPGTKGLPYSPRCWRDGAHGGAVRDAAPGLVALPLGVVDAEFRVARSLRTRRSARRNVRGRAR
jgi:predicted phosphodiesterase